MAEVRVKRIKGRRSGRKIKIRKIEDKAEEEKKCRNR
jgi:hypothetical protein